jgi:hypothetical protein
VKITVLIRAFAKYRTPLADLRVQAIKAADCPRKVADGEGLYLYVSPSGTNFWRMDFAFAGKRLTYTMGKYPNMCFNSTGFTRVKRRTFAIYGGNGRE